MTLDPKAKKHTLRLLHHNVTIVTSGRGADILGATVTWVMQTSFEPPLLTLAVKADSRLYELIKECQACVVNIVPAGNEALAAAFFRAPSITEGNLGGYAATAHANAGAILETAPAWMACEVRQIIPEGDHHLVVTEVVEATVNDSSIKAMSLSDTNWHYGG
jgi:flavin reductase (DIM6/NTAB) family NADH-FMN oxidoreductase RutF